MPDDDQPYAGEPPDRRGVAEEHDAERRGADGPHPGPDRVGGADRQVAQRQAEEPEADHHRDDGQRRRHRPGEAFGVFQADRPADLEEAGDDEQRPGHGGVLEAYLRGEWPRGRREFSRLGSATLGRGRCLLTNFGGDFSLRSAL